MTGEHGSGYSARILDEARRYSRRGFLATVVTVAGGVVLSACTTNVGGGSGASGSTAPAGNAGGKITLSHWYHQYGEAGTQEAVLRYAKEYTAKNPNVQVNVTWVPGDYATKSAAALLTSDAPDVFEGSPTLAMVKANQITALDDIMTAEVKADFDPKDIEAATINGKIYAVKMVDDTAMIYYRKSTLDAAGVKPPTTMAEVIAAAQKLTKGNTKGLYLGNDGGISALLTLLPFSNKAQFIKDDKILFDTPQTVAAYKSLADLNATGSLLLGVPTDWFDPDSFTQGLAAMQWCGLWAMPAIKKALNDDFGIIPWPAFDANGTPATFRGGWGEMVGAQSKNLQAAKEYVKYLWIASKETQTDFSLSYGFHVPPRKSVAATATQLTTGPAKEAVDIVNKYGTILPPTWDAAMTTALTDALSNVVKNKADAQSEVTKAAQKCQDELKRVLA